ncbi:MAG TPA: hypothetical protein P5137_07210 [Candidatus Brocadiia bacterium]|nr:hypothetical protein [Candidatus Brocadiia bacterium]
MKLTCDRCGKILLVDEDVRYKVRIEVFAAYDPMEVTQDDLARDNRAEMLRLVRALRGLDPERAQDSVHRQMEFEICPACQRAYLADPLGMGAQGSGGSA